MNPIKTTGGKNEPNIIFIRKFVVLFVCVPCPVYPMLPVSLDCPFLIAPSVLSNVYL